MADVMPDMCFRNCCCGSKSVVGEAANAVLKCCAKDSLCVFLTGFITYLIEN